MTLKDITSRVIGYTNTTKDMNGIIIPIIDDGNDIYGRIWRI